MRKLTKEDLYLKNVDTLKQYKILEYLKGCLKIEAFDVYLFNNKTIKVVDKNGESGYFEYNDKTNDILFKEKMTKEKEKGFGL